MRRKRKLPNAIVVQFLDKLVFVPVVLQRHVLGSVRGCVSATDHGRCGGDSACACLRGGDRGVPAPQIMEVFVVPQITEEIVEVIQLGTSLSTCSLLCNDTCWERQSRKLWRFHSCSFLGVVQLLDKVVDTPPGVQRQARGPDCAENRGVSAVTALGRVCPGSSGQFSSPR